jgi:hypothetical protein
MKAETVSQTFNGLVEWRLEGNYFKLLTAAAAVRVELFLGGRTVLLAPSVAAGFYQRAAFDQVKVTTSSLILVEFLAAPEEGGLDRAVTEIDNLYADTLTNETSAVVGVAAASALAAAAGRKWLRFRSRSTNTDDICLGGAAVTMNGPLRISPGEVLDVTTAAPAEWFGISGTAAQNLDILSGA